MVVVLCVGLIQQQTRKHVSGREKKSLQYLIGAPLAWAGLSSTVMVVAVSFRKASDPSYSSIVGAAEKHQSLNKLHLINKKYRKKCLMNKIKMKYEPEMLVVTLSVVAGPKPLEVEARIDSWYVTPGWSWENR